MIVADDEPWPFKESDRHAWPVGPSGQEQKLWEAKLEVRKKRTDQEIQEAKVQLEADLALEKQYYDAVIEVAKGSIERARASADNVQKAAAAIITLYTGILGVSFSVAERPLPTRAVFAAVLLGLAIALATVFIAYLPDPKDSQDEEADAGLSPPDLRTAMFIRWTREAALRNRKWLRASVVALATSLFFLPAPFVVIGDKEVQPPETAIDWPDEPDAPANLQLKKILYAAQVAEAAKEETTPVASEDQASNGFWLGTFFFALLLVVFVPQIGSRPSTPTLPRGSP